ncbi:hypothetical protein D3C85_452550 [compost metagenome]
MAYTAAFEPQVLRTHPRNLAKKVANKTVVQVDFNTDLDRAHIVPYVVVTDGEGNRINGTVTYNERTVSFEPSSPFLSLQTVRVMIVGDDLSGKDIGIRSVLGTKMKGNYNLSFTIIENPLVRPPKLVFPASESVIKDEPTFKWEAVTGADKYQIQLSKFNTMVPVIWPMDSENYTIDNELTELRPDIQLEDGIYYWRMRSVDATGEHGEWTTLATFNKDTVEEGKVSDDDAPKIDLPIVDRPPDYIEDDYLEIIEVFPQDGFSNVATNLRMIYVRVMGNVTKEEAHGAFTVTGTRVDDDESDPSLLHGELEGDIEVYPDGDTTVIAFMLKPVEEVS